MALEKALRVPWISRRSNQSILKEISPEYSLEGLMLKLKLQYFDHLMQRTAAAAKSLQSCPTLCNPIDWTMKPTRLRRPWNSPGKNTGVGCHFLLQYMKVKSESEVKLTHWKRP